jgi:hypothetical protein
MAAAATARKASPRARRAPRASARTARPAPRRAPRPAPRAAPRLVPVAVGRTAVAVGGIADSGLVLRLTRSRLWIGALGSLLVGIVALNVAALSFNAASSKTAGFSDELRRENSALRAQIENGLSNERVLETANRLGLGIPEPGTIRYLEPAPGDAAAAADRLRQGAITIGTEYVPPPPVAPMPTETTEATETTVPAETTVPTETTDTTVPADTTEPAGTTAAPVAGGITAAP